MLGRTAALGFEGSKNAQAAFDAVVSVSAECLRQPAKLPSANPTRSFWTHSSPDANPLAREGSHGPLTTDADICIIGSGISGISVAYHIAEAVGNQTILDAPLRVVILEARDFCPWRNGGHLTPHTFYSFAVRQNQFGTDEAIRSSALEERTASSLVNIIERNGWSEKVDLVSGGNVCLFFTEDEERGTRTDFECINVDDVQWLTRDAVENLVTLLYQHAKQRTSEHFDLKLHTRTPVTSITRSSSEDSNAGSTYILSTPRGSISCSRIVHATNAYASHLLPSLAGPSGQAPTKTNGWIANRGCEYWFPQTPLVILGGGREASGPQFELYVDDDSSINPVVGKELRKFLPAVFEGKPEHGNEPEMEWTGIMGYTATGDPFVGPVFNFSTGQKEDYEGQYIAAGYTGHGMPRAFAWFVVQMIIAELTGTQWSRPTWFPKRYLTESRLKHRN
ncbi:hypothetical protein BKA83DRAFT_682572 [Pisolithus microcarpus]|nr:hypothetical protein BKA83DRAFT_682572 [Pisolithus microcarpus]